VRQAATELGVLRFIKMSVYKGVALFGSFDENVSTSKFPQWQKKTQTVIQQQFPESFKFISKTRAELERDFRGCSRE
jgi:DNA primase